MHASSNRRALTFNPNLLTKYQQSYPIRFLSVSLKIDCSDRLANIFRDVFCMLQFIMLNHSRPLKDKWLLC